MKWFIKAAAAGLIALALLCVLCLWYYDIPVHYVNPSDATEYKWISSRRYIKGTEGYSFGRTNNDGFINISDYSPGDRIDILLMGSSHMEGMNLSPEDNTAAVLNDLFQGERYTYSIGTAGHNLLYCVKHLDKALSTYSPSGYVVIESYDLCLPPEDIAAVLDGSLPDIPSHTGGITGIMQKLPFLRLAYTRLVEGSGEAEEEEDAPPVGSGYEGWEETDELLSYISEACRRHGVTPVIAYHAPVLCGSDGRGYSAGDGDAISRFRSLCEDKGIVFADACEDFVQGFNDCHRLPYGFLNTVPGEGHMNAWGHGLFARCIRDSISEWEA